MNKAGGSGPLGPGGQEPTGAACERCGENPATVHVRRVAGGEEREFHVCPACAQELGAAPPQAGDDPVNVLLQGLGGIAGAGVCPGCGLTWERFRSTGRLGCASCYETFRGELRPLLRRIHGAVRHEGRVPRSAPADGHAARMRRLHEELELAVEAEDYERAAELRDRLAALEPAADTGGGEREP